MKPIHFKIYFYPLLITLIFLNSTSLEKNDKSEKSIDPINNIYAPFEKLTNDLNDYIWPTDASYKITSSFAEYRSSHFHGGIDISTNLKEGFKVFASREGYVARIQILPNGYGKMLYLRHPDGYYTAYAHLMDFSQKIKQVLYAEQVKRATYFIDLWLDSLSVPVDKGELVAFTGNTGAGPAHLHFEVLDENLNPVNPTLFTNLRINDNVPPIIKKLFIAPADEFSLVEEKNDYHIIKLQSNKSNYDIKKPVNVTGKIKFGVEAKDFGSQYSAKTGVYRIKFYLDDSLIYELQYDRIPSEFTHEILLHYDLTLLENNKGKFQKLYVENGNDLPIYKKFPYGSGIIDCSKLNEGLHNFKITISDFYENESSITGTLRIKKIPKFKILSVDESRIKLTGENLYNIDAILVEAKSKTQSNSKTFRFTKKDLEISDSIITIHFPTNGYELKITGVDQNNTTTIPLIYNSNNKISDDVSIRYEIVQNRIKCVLNTNQIILPDLKVLLLEGNKNKSIDLKQIKKDEYIGSIQPDPNYIGPRKIKLIDSKTNQTIKSTEEFYIYPILANKSGTYSISNGKILINFDSAAVFEDFIMTIDSVQEGEKTIYKFYPQDKPLKKGIKIKVKANQKLEKIYFDKDGKWVIQNWDSDLDSLYLTARFKYKLTDVTLLSDMTPPSVTMLKTKRFGNQSHLIFKFKDNLSGINYNQIKLYVDKKLEIPEIDDEKNTLKYITETRNLRNIYTIEIEVVDKAGNVGKFTKQLKTKVRS